MRIFLALLMALISSSAMATDLPLSSTRPMLYITTDRLSDMQDKKTANETGWAFLKSRTDSFLVTNPYYPAEMSAAMALAFNIDSSLTSHRDRAIDLLFGMFVDRADSRYWSIDSEAATITTLSAGITNSATTISLTSATGFVTAGATGGLAAIGSELVKFTGVSGNDLTGCTRGYLSTTAASYSSGERVEAVSTSFGDADDIRGQGPFALLAYDWLYNSLTTQQKSDFRARIILWGKVWSYVADAPTGTNNPYNHDSDQNTSLAEIIVLIGYDLYNDDAYASTAFDNADGLFNNIVMADYVNTYFLGGIWGEGTNYSALTIQFAVRKSLVDKEARGLNYPTGMTNYISGCIKGWWHLTFPNNTGMLPYSDMEGFDSDYIDLRKHNRLELSYILQGVSEVATDKSLAKKWSETAITTDGAATASELYTGLYRVLFDDPDVTSTAPTSSNIPLNYTSEGLRFHALRTGWGATDDAVYIYGHKDLYDHAHWTAGHYEIISDGVVITKENTGYGYTIITGQGLAHNNLTIDGHNNGYGSQQGTYSVGDAEIERNFGSDAFNYIRHDLTDLFNYTGYQPEVPVDNYTRKFIYIKGSNTLVVQDYVDISGDSDCSFTGSNHTGTNVACTPRWKKLYQHFQSEPTLSSGIYSATTEGKVLNFKPLIPTDSTRTIINESTTTPWSTAAAADLPANQKKYNVRIENASSSTNPVQFLNVLHWANSGTAMPTTTALTVTGGTGLVSGSNAVILSESNLDISSASYTTDATTHYISDLPVNSSIEVTRGGAAVSGSPFDSGDAGVITFSAASGSATYEVNNGGGAPSGAASLNGSGNAVLTGSGGLTIQ